MKKRRKYAGFTLTESLVCLVILMLVSMTVFSVIVGSRTVYAKSVFLSESDMFADTVNVRLADMLRYANRIEVTAGGQVLFGNVDYGMVGGHLACENGFLVYYYNDGLAHTALVGETAYAMLRMKDFILTYDSDTSIFTGNYTLFSKGDEALYITKTFTFQNLYSRS